MNHNYRSFLPLQQLSPARIFLRETTSTAALVLLLACLPQPSAAIPAILASENEALDGDVVTIFQGSGRGGGIDGNDDVRELEEEKKKCFENGAELRAAANAYEDPEVLKTYGAVVDWCVGDVADFSNVFLSKMQFNEEISRWNTSSATDMSYMFYYADSFNQPLNDWDLSGVTSMKTMFAWAYSFNQPLNGWNVSGVTDMSGMFRHAGSFNQPLSGWDVSGVTSMKEMFEETDAFNQPLLGWDVSGVSDMSWMFYWALSFNQHISRWNTSSAKTMSGMFEGAVSFNQPLSDWDVSGVEDMSAMFYAAGSFNQSLCTWLPRMRDGGGDGGGDDSTVVDTEEILIKSSCPSTESPVAPYSETDPFCHECDDSSSPAIQDAADSSSSETDLDYFSLQEESDPPYLQDEPDSSSRCSQRSPGDTLLATTLVFVVVLLVTGVGEYRNIEIRMKSNLTANNTATQ